MNAKKKINIILKNCIKLINKLFIKCDRLKKLLKIMKQYNFKKIRKPRIQKIWINIWKKLIIV